MLFFYVFDYDKGIDDDRLGRVSIGLTTIVKEGTRDYTLQLENVRSGQIRLHLDWFWLSHDASELERILNINECAINKQTAAVLMVFLHSAKSLPMVTGEPSSKYSPKNLMCNQKVPRQPSPKVVLSVGQQVKESSVKDETTEPRWEQGFRFTVINPNHQYLNLDVIDTNTKKCIGESSIKLKELLSSPELIMDQKFVIKSSDPGSHFVLWLCLRILTPEFNPDWHNEEKFTVL